MGLILPKSLLQIGLPDLEAGEELVLRDIVDVLDAGRDAEQVDLIPGDPTIDRRSGGWGRARPPRGPPGTPCRRASVPCSCRSRRSAANRSSPVRHAGRLAEQGLGGRARRLRPGLAEVGRIAETDEGTQPRPVVVDALVLPGTMPAGMQAVSAVVPDAVVYQAAARIAAGVGRRIATCRRPGRSPAVSADRRRRSSHSRWWPVPPELDFSPLTFPSVHGEYSLPSEAQEGYQVSAPVYSACRPVKRRPLSVADGWKGQSCGGSDRQTPSTSRAGGASVGRCSAAGVLPAASRQSTVKVNRSILRRIAW